ncbi:MAG: cupin domain-containing protein [Acetobacteraceae bacterium]|nr:cupin domain-containing protein [Acetobacteraceae bacterium]
MSFATRRSSREPDVTAPDGSEVRILCATGRASVALFSLGPYQVSKAVAHHTVEEIWYFLSGYGRIWRRFGDDEEVIKVEPGVSITIPTGTHFQFRSDSAEPLCALGATMPPWPGEGEPYLVEGKWDHTE